MRGEAEGLQGPQASALSSGLEARIAATRACGAVTVRLESVEAGGREDAAVAGEEAAVASLDALLGRAGMRPLGSDWRSIPEREATHLVTDWLHRDLAYRVVCLQDRAARALAREFTGSFPPDALFFTNAGLWTDGPRTWTPATDATFDCGVGVVSATRVGILWVQDEN